MANEIPNEILDRASLDAALGAERFLLFKHSGRCSISSRAFAEYEAYVSEHTGVPTGWIDVVNRRELSHTAAQQTGVEHKSPQAIWIVDGVAVWNASHFDITQASLAEAAETAG
ncbi:MAG: bacillithiol system redox-active protein YtxJ [Planctomycetota bacterium]